MRRLGDYLNSQYGLKEEDLQLEVPQEICRNIANLLGGDWENLAMYLISQAMIDDIIARYPNNPGQRRQELMNRWKQMLGRQATYLIMVRSLDQIHRRDIIDQVLEGFIARERVQFRRAHHSQRQQAPRISTYVFYTLVLVASLLSTQTHLFTRDSEATSQSPTAIAPGLSLQTSEEVASDNSLSTLDQLPVSDLPSVDSFFVGRELDLFEIAAKIKNSSVVNINGAPGFGKSRLAIEVGSKLHKGYAPVRYISVDEKFLAQYAFPLNSVYIDELRTWSEGLTTKTVLVLDNCDEVLESSFRIPFLELVCKLVLSSKLKLHIVITSREKLVLSQCQVDWWTVHPINESSSVKILERKAGTHFNHTDLVKIAKLIQGSPLALTIVGRILYLRREDKWFPNLLIQDLRSRPIRALEEDSLKQFHRIMDFVYQCIQRRELSECGEYICLFPGSFSRTAGIHIIPNKFGQHCIKNFLTFSLIDQTSYANNTMTRYTMHRLIREYFKQYLSKESKKKFKKLFYKYHQTNFLQYTKKFTLSMLEEYEVITSEIHTIRYFLKLLASKKSLQHEDLAVIGFLYKHGQCKLEDLQIENLSIQFLESTHKVCSLLHKKTCGKLYASIVSHLYGKCKCQYLSDYFGNVIRLQSGAKCTRIFHCEVIDQLYQIKEMLPYSEQNYINRVRLLHCLGAFAEVNRISQLLLLIVDIVLHYNLKVNFMYRFLLRVILACVLSSITFQLEESSIHIYAEVIMKFFCFEIFHPIIYLFVVFFVVSLLQCLFGYNLLKHARFIRECVYFVSLFSRDLNLNFEVSVCRFLPICH